MRLGRLLTGVLVAAAIGMGAGASQARASTWYVRAGADGTGTATAPFGSLAAVQSAAKPGDTIVVRPSTAALDGGIALQAGQQLIGAGPPIAGKTGTLAQLPALQNTTDAHLDGDAVRLAPDTTVQNIAVKTAYRGGIYGLDSVGVKILGNDISGQNTSCTDGFTVQAFNIPTGTPFVSGPPSDAPQNGWAGIMVDGQSASGAVTIENNDVHDATCGDGIDIRAMGIANFTARVDSNTVTHLAQGSTLSSVLGIGMQALNAGHLSVTQDGDTETDIGSPNADCEGEFANAADSGAVVDTVDHNTFDHGVGFFSCNGFESIISTGTATIDVNLANSTFRDNVGDMLEEYNLGGGSTMTFTARNVIADGTTWREPNAPGSSDGGANPAPFNLGDCMLVLSVGGGNSTTFTMSDSILENCNNGLSVGNNAGTGNGSGPIERLVLNVTHSVITRNAKYGVLFYNTTPAQLLQSSIATSTISDNSEPGVSIVENPTGSAQTAQYDLGGASLGSPGGNCFFGNGGDDVEATDVAITADHDWWGHPGPPTALQTANRIGGQVSTDGGLATEPACVPTVTGSGSSSPPKAEPPPATPPPHQGCPLAGGRMTATAIDGFRLGMTRAAARRVDRKSTDRGRPYSDFFCLTPIGIRVGYPSPALQRSLGRAVGRKVAGTIVFVSTANPRYGLHGIRPGAALPRGERAFHGGHKFVIGANDWYLAPHGASTVVFKARRGIIEEIGLARLSLTRTRRAQRRFISALD